MKTETIKLVEKIVIDLVREWERFRIEKLTVNKLLLLTHDACLLRRVNVNMNDLWDIIPAMWKRDELVYDKDSHPLDIFVSLPKTTPPLTPKAAPEESPEPRALPPSRIDDLIAQARAEWVASWVAGTTIRDEAAVDQFIVRLKLLISRGGA